MFSLKTNRLRVDIPEPGEAPNTTTRFDRAGFISDIVLDGTYHFCASEPRNLRHPCTGGRGLCNEWCFDVSGEVEIGEYFPKFGVGLIRKEEDIKYIFHRHFKDVVPFEVKFEHTDTTARFVTDTEPCIGYAMKSTKEITVEDNTITMVITAENTGEKVINMREFCHNFVTIDGMALGSDYKLDLPNSYDLGNSRLIDRNAQTSSWRGNGKGMTFCEFSAVATDFALDPKRLSDDIPFVWRLSHQGAKLYIETEDFYKPARISIWAVDHVISPEVNIEFTINPGESYTWKRRWTFGHM